MFFAEGLISECKIASGTSPASSNVSCSPVTHQDSVWINDKNPFYWTSTRDCVLSKFSPKYINVINGKRVRRVRNLESCCVTRANTVFKASAELLSSSIGLLIKESDPKCVQHREPYRTRREATEHEKIIFFFSPASPARAEHYRTIWQRYTPHAYQLTSRDTSRDFTIKIQSLHLTIIAWSWTEKDKILVAISSQQASITLLAR